MEMTSAASEDVIRVALVDDHPLMCDGLRRALGSAADIDVVGEAHTGADALAMFHASDPDVVLLDFRLPDTDGITVLRRARKEGCRAKVVMLTCVADERCVRKAIDSGACGFLTKRSASGQVLIDAIRHAHQGMSAVSPDALTTLLSAVRENRADCADHITPREREVWRLVADGRTNGEIAGALYLSERTVKFHVGNILRKTASRTRAEATALAYRCGLMDREA